MKAAIRRGSIIVAGILAATLFHSAAMAESLDAAWEKEVVEFSFHFSRAELGTQRGAERVYEALVRRATKACTTPLAGSNLRRRDDACVAGLVEKVVRKIDAGMLTSHWRRSAPGSVQQPVALR